MELEPGEVLDIRSVDVSRRSAHLVRAQSLEVIRLSLNAGEEIPPHHARGEIVVQCLDGHIAFTARGQTRELRPGQLLYLSPGEEHSLKSIEKSIVVVTKALSVPAQLP
jgi:quercetin dioxygenase-like cupin family protein